MPRSIDDDVGLIRLQSGLLPMRPEGCRRARVTKTKRQKRAYRPSFSGNVGSGSIESSLARLALSPVQCFILDLDLLRTDRSDAYCCFNCIRCWTHGCVLEQS
jgi:hypothetical protein